MPCRRRRRLHAKLYGLLRRRASIVVLSESAIRECQVREREGMAGAPLQRLVGLGHRLLVAPHAVVNQGKRVRRP
jgi:hypothetical protein